MSFQYWQDYGEYLCHVLNKTLEFLYVQNYFEEIEICISFVPDVKDRRIDID